MSIPPTIFDNFDENEALLRLSHNLEDPTACTDIIRLLGRDYRGYNTMTNIMLDLMDSSPLFADGESSTTVLDYTQKHFMHNFDLETFERNVQVKEQADPGNREIEKALVSVVENSSWRESLIHLARNFAGQSIMSEIGAIVKDYLTRSQESTIGTKQGDADLALLDSEQSLSTYISELQTRVMVFMTALSPANTTPSAADSWRGMREWKDLLAWMCSSQIAFIASYNLLSVLAKNTTTSPTISTTLRLICAHAATHVLSLSPASPTSLHSLQCTMANIPTSMVTPLSSLLTPSPYHIIMYQQLKKRLYSLHNASLTNPSGKPASEFPDPESWSWEFRDGNSSENGIDPYPISALHRHYLPVISCILPHLYQRQHISSDELSRYSCNMEAPGSYPSSGSGAANQYEHPACQELRQELQKTISLSFLVDPTMLTSTTIPPTMAIARVMVTTAMRTSTPQQKETITQAVQLLTLIETCRQLPSSSPSISSTSTSASSSPPSPSSSLWLHDTYLSARKLTSLLFTLAGNIERGGSYLLQTSPTTLAATLASHLHISVVADVVLQWIEAILQDHKHTVYSATSLHDHHHVFLAILLHIARIHPVRLAHVHALLRRFILHEDTTASGSSSGIVKESVLTTICALAMFPDATSTSTSAFASASESPLTLIPFEVTVLGHPLLATLVWMYDNASQLSATLILKSLLLVLPSLATIHETSKQIKSIPYSVLFCLWSYVLRNNNVQNALKCPDSSVSEVKMALNNAKKSILLLSLTDVADKDHGSVSKNDDSNVVASSAWKSSLVDAIDALLSVATTSISVSAGTGVQHVSTIPISSPSASFSSSSSSSSSAASATTTTTVTTAIPAAPAATAAASVVAEDMNIGIDDLFGDDSDDDDTSAMDDNNDNTKKAMIHTSTTPSVPVAASTPARVTQSVTISSFTKPTGTPTENTSARPAKRRRILDDDDD